VQSLGVTPEVFGDTEGAGLLGKEIGTIRGLGTRRRWAAGLTYGRAAHCRAKL
jgi:hypothetical protein